MGKTMHYDNYRTETLQLSKKWYSAGIIFVQEISMGTLLLDLLEEW